ncbi:hypothetical protein GCM10010231_42770 [Streptomyces sindenensis]|nr:hypothetical protein GCM10010231_42770 [Streptomyces sindenensis]
MAASSLLVPAGPRVATFQPLAVVGMEMSRNFWSVGCCTVFLPPVLAGSGAWEFIGAARE